MTSLDQLFPDGPREKAAAEIDDRRAKQHLHELLGPPLLSRSADESADVPRILAMVHAAAKNPSTFPGVGAVPAPHRVRRRRRQRDLVTLSAAALAVVALLTAGTVGVVQAATSSPAQDAVAALRADERTIGTLQGALQDDSARLAEEKEAAVQDAEALRAALLEARAAPDPREFGGEDAPKMAVLDADDLKAMLDRIDTHLAAVEAVPIPDRPADYRRGEVDEQSLASVGRAIDAGQQQLDALDAATGDLRAARKQFDQTASEFDAQLSAYAETFPKEAARAVARFPDAAEHLREELTDAAEELSATRLTGGESGHALTAYREAYVAVVQDQVRVEIERRAAEEERRRQEERDNPQPTSPPPTEPTPPPDDRGNGSG